MEEADVRAQNNGGRTPLQLAAEKGHAVVLKKLVKEGDINARDKKGLGAIHWASRMGHLHSVELLVNEDPALLMQSGASGRTALHEAATLGHLEVTKWLIERNPAILNMVNSEKETGLHCAVKQGNVEIVKLLLDKKIDVLLEDKNGQTAETVALTLTNSEILKCFDEVRDPLTLPGALERKIDQLALESFAIPLPIPPIKTFSGERFLQVPGPIRVAYRTNPFTPMSGRSVVGRTITFSL